MAFVTKGAATGSKPEAGSLQGVATGDGYVGNPNCEVAVPGGFMAIVVEIPKNLIPWDGGNSPGLARRIQVNIGTAARIVDASGQEVTLEAGYTTKVSCEVYLTADKAPK